VPDFTRVINQAYVRILGRPVDPGGLESYNQAMNQGLTEAQMRESLLRSLEYAEKNPDPVARAATASQRKKSSKTKKKKSGASRGSSRKR
jgi:hypothetical protein